MQQIWQQIETWLTGNAPEVLARLRPGASAEQLRDAESILGISFPEDVRASYLLHDGCNNPCGFIDGLDFLSLEAVIDEWRVWKELLDGENFIKFESEPDLGVKSDWWNPRWIPLTYNDCGDHFCLDMDPAPGGKPGQIITMWHDSPERTLVAVSFSDWFQQFAEALQAGLYCTSEEYYGLVSINDV